MAASGKPSLPNGSLRMERDVIRLITKGRTNPQIAQELRDKVATGGYTRSPIPGHQDA